MKDELKEIFDLYEKQADNPDLAILIKTLKEWYFEKEDYKSRNEKAIEILESDDAYSMVEYALKILKGKE